MYTYNVRRTLYVCVCGYVKYVAKQRCNTPYLRNVINIYFASKGPVALEYVWHWPETIQSKTIQR